MEKIKKEFFGTSKDGENVYRYTLENSNGMQVKIINYACAIQSLLVPDKYGVQTDVVLGYDQLESYEKGDCFFGAFVGRYANRIKNAEFMLNGKLYKLPQNDGNNHLHGTFAHRVFPARISENKLIFDGVSEAGEEGYPGKLTFCVTYELSEDNALSITYEAQTDADTVVNFTNHSYFNLNGQDGSTVLQHILRLDADFFTEADAQTLTTGRILPVERTPMDFRNGKKIGSEIDSEFDQIKMCFGYDHNFVLNHSNGLSHFGMLYSEKTGIVMQCYTTQPGVQIYSGNYLQDEPGKAGVKYPKHGAVCLETQHFPCSPNIPEFPSTVLAKGEHYIQETKYSFEIQKALDM